MPGTLKFPLDKVIAEIAKVKAAPAHRVLYGETVGPCLFLVGDRGVYLMGNQVREEKPPFDVVYAEGLDPNADDEWWVKKREIFGGDDGVDYFTLDRLAETIRIAEAAKAEHLIIRLNKKFMAVSFE